MWLKQRKLTFTELLQEQEFFSLPTIPSDIKEGHLLVTAVEGKGIALRYLISEVHLCSLASCTPKPIQQPGVLTT